jgi:hypothetical protein
LFLVFFWLHVCFYQVEFLIRFDDIPICFHNYQISNVILFNCVLMMIIMILKKKKSILVLMSSCLRNRLRATHASVPCTSLLPCFWDFERMLTHLRQILSNSFEKQTYCLMSQNSPEFWVPRLLWQRLFVLGNHNHHPVNYARLQASAPWGHHPAQQWYRVGMASSSPLPFRRCLGPPLAFPRLGWGGSL